MMELRAHLAFVPIEGATMADPIKHVVLLMLENASCDRYLGYLSESVYPFPVFNGVDPTGPPRENVDWRGRVFKQLPTATRQMQLDPMHEQQNVKTQLANENQGFVKDLEVKYGVKGFEEKDRAEYSQDELDENYRNVMAYYRQGALPAHHTLAENYRPCDAWFCSVPGPTWPNRFFALSGSSNGLVHMPNSEKGAGGFFKTAKMLTYEFQPTIFSRLADAGKTFKIYYHDFPCSTVLWQNTLDRRIRNNYELIEEFDKASKGPASAFPEFVFIEPRYFGADQNDDHPPHNVMKGQKLVTKIYNAIRGNEELWNSTLLVVVHDEHGGFYDHVVPPKTAVPPQKKLSWHEDEFTQFGPRVPALLISPYVKRGVENHIFDHTSVLKYLKELWSLGELGDRVESSATNSIGIALDINSPPRTDCIGQIEGPSNDDLLPDHPEWETRANPNHYASDLFKRLLLNSTVFAVASEVFEKHGKIKDLSKEDWKKLGRRAFWRIMWEMLKNLFHDYFKSVEEKKAADVRRIKEVQLLLQSTPVNKGT
jgi:phospholipase C